MSPLFRLALLAVLSTSVSAFLGAGLPRVQSSSRRAVRAAAEATKFASFDAMVASFEEPVVVVDFYAKWCGPCQLMVPVLDKFASEQEGKIAVAKVDTDKFPTLAERFAVGGLPTFVVFKGGEEVGRVEGGMGKDQLLKSVTKFI